MEMKNVTKLHANTIMLGMCIVLITSHPLQLVLLDILHICSMIFAYHLMLASELYQVFANT